MNNTKAQLAFYGGAGNVTGANFLLTWKDKKILVDCGLVQGIQEKEDANRRKWQYDPAQIDVLMITHAHTDHIGLVPRLVKDGFRGVIYSTAPTKDIAEVSFADAVRHVEREAKEKNVEPLFDGADVQKALSLWKTVSYHDNLKLGSDISVVPYDAGHILGSAIFVFTILNTKIGFTGDLGNSPSPILKDIEDVSGLDYLITESVYGDRVHEQKDDRQKRLEEIFEETVEAKGALMIPAFSIERTQEILYALNNLIESGAVPKVPIFLDSPFAIAVTNIYRKYKYLFNQETKDVIADGDDIFAFPKLVFTKEVEDSKHINNIPNPKVIIAGSGMSTGGRIVHHQRRYLQDPRSTLLIMGYQAAGTPGRVLQGKPKKIKMFNDLIPVRARIETITGYSGHADRDRLLEFVELSQSSLKHVWCAMGEIHAASFLCQRIRDYLGLKASVANPDQVVDIVIT